MNEFPDDDIEELKAKLKTANKAIEKEQPPEILLGKHSQVLGKGPQPSRKVSGGSRRSRKSSGRRQGEARGAAGGSQNHRGSHRGPQTPGGRLYGKREYDIADWKHRHHREYDLHGHSAVERLRTRHNGDEFPTIREQRSHRGRPGQSAGQKDPPGSCGGNCPHPCWRCGTSSKTPSRRTGSANHRRP